MFTDDFVHGVQVFKLRKIDVVVKTLFFPQARRSKKAALLFPEGVWPSRQRDGLDS